MGNHKQNPIVDKAMAFAVRVYKLHRYLNSSKSEYVVSKQLLRSGSSIGANIAEAQEAISTNDFKSKIYIALKEARETEFWLKMLYNAGVLSQNEFSSINGDLTEILKILVSITKSLGAKESGAKA